MSERWGVCSCDGYSDDCLICGGSGWTGDMSKRYEFVSQARKRTVSKAFKKLDWEPIMKEILERNKKLRARR